ncbi:MAG: GTPase HflX [Parachlamydiaceae bacterium]|nr:GTPase HflX [Parachlamydiaceae bacterium]
MPIDPTPKKTTKEHNSTEPEQKALLVSVYKNTADKAMCEEHLTELKLLAETFGVTTMGKVGCFLRKYEASTLIGSGKLEELVLLANELEVDMIIFDDEITPGQQRNLEAAFKLPVIDRTEVILGVFAQRAHTKEAHLQIELAQVKYQAPRLKRLWTHLSRQGGTSGGGRSGGGGHLKGEGEKQIEIDRRILKKEIEHLQHEIDEVRAMRETQRALRVKAGIPVLAIIGYTNAGKSTLLNALTDANVFVENKLFATLDTTTRKFKLENNQEILLIDTVGFIRKLPHLLVAAFKSTLEEALFSDILLHLIDISHPMAEEQAAASLEVLKELNAEDKPIITVLNKIESCNDIRRIDRIKLQYPKCVLISALHKTGLEELQERIIFELSKRRRRVLLQIPQSQYGDVTEAIRVGRVISQSYEDNNVLLEVELPVELANKLQHYAIS